MSLNISLISLVAVYTSIFSLSSIPNTLSETCETSCISEVTSTTELLTNKTKKNAARATTSLLLLSASSERNLSIAQPKASVSQKFLRETIIEPKYSVLPTVAESMVASEVTPRQLGVSVNNDLEPQSNKASISLESSQPSVFTPPETFLAERGHLSEFKTKQIQPTLLEKSTQLFRKSKSNREKIQTLKNKISVAFKEVDLPKAKKNSQLLLDEVRIQRTSLEETDAVATKEVNALKVEEAYALISFGQVSFSVGEYQDAIDLYNQALGSYETANYDFGKFHTLIRLGEAFFKLKKLQESILCFQQSIEILKNSQEFKLSPDRAQTLDKLEKINQAFVSLSQNEQREKAEIQATEYKRILSPLADRIFNRDLSREEEPGLPFKISDGIEGRIMPRSKNSQLQIEKRGKDVTIQTQIPVVRIGTPFPNLDACEPKSQPFDWSVDFGFGMKFGKRGISTSPFINLGVSLPIPAKPLPIELKSKCLGTNDFGFISTVKNESQPLGLQQHGAQKALEAAIAPFNVDSKVLDTLLRDSRINNSRNQLFAFASQSSSQNSTSENNLSSIYLLGNLGNLAVEKKQYQEAVEQYQNCLQSAQPSRHRVVEMSCLNNLGVVYRLLKHYELSFERHQEALVIAQTIGDRIAERLVFSNLGSLRAQQQRFDEAIAFYKESINLTEAIKNKNKEFPKKQQQSYIETVAETYRQLADLLLTQGRILEAQRVLELLKIQEIHDYTRDTRAVVTERGIWHTPGEKAILDKFTSLIGFGKEVDKCQQTRCNELAKLTNQRETLTGEYNQAMEKLARVIRDRKSKDDAFFDPRNLDTNARKIVEAQSGTLLVYPFVLENKLWLLWVAPNGIVNRVEVPVTQKHLGETAIRFRELLSRENSDVVEVKATGQQLYQWLIKPLEKELNENKIQALVFSLDRVTRYIPMAALFDGKQYLVEKYQVSTILSAELTNMNDRLSTSTKDNRVLALGLSESKEGFNALRNVPAELDAIVRSNPSDGLGVYPGKTFLNRQFTLRNLKDNLRDHRILHIATHGKFFPGLPKASYLLTGEEKNLTVPEINTLYNLSGIHLAVLSACETALGGPDSEGLELAGLGYYFTVGDRAKAVLASLWLVNDSSTRQLMQQFYSNLATDKMTKAEALQQAQQTMIHKGGKGGDGNRSSVTYTLPQGGLDAVISRDLSHPFYWAPFILIGNRL